MEDNNQNNSDLSEEKDEIRDELDLEAEVLLREIEEDNKNFEVKTSRQIDKLAEGVDEAIGEMETFHDKMETVLEEQGKKADEIASEIDQEAKKEEAKLEAGEEQDNQ